MFHTELTITHFGLINNLFTIKDFVRERLKYICKKFSFCVCTQKKKNHL